jgi:hypothetical protein
MKEQKQELSELFAVRNPNERQTVYRKRLQQRQV